MHKIGQEHLEGVLILSDTRAILGFRCEADMMATMHHLNVAIVWQGKSVILHTLPLKGRQVTEYMVARYSHPLGVQTHAQARGLVPSLFPMHPAWKRGYQRPRDLHSEQN